MALSTPTLARRGWVAPARRVMDNASRAAIALQHTNKYLMCWPFPPQPIPVNQPTRVPLGADDYEDALL